MSMPTMLVLRPQPRSSFLVSGLYIYPYVQHLQTITPLIVTFFKSLSTILQVERSSE